MLELKKGDGARDGDARIYSLAVPVLHWVPEAFFSRASGSFVSSAEGRRHERRSFSRGPLLNLTERGRA